MRAAWHAHGLLFAAGRMDTLEERLGSIESVLEGFLDEIRGVISAAAAGNNT